MKLLDVPTYKLYGEQDAWPTPDLVHCESIATRSRMHDWHIMPHQHTGLLQILYLKIGDAKVHLDGQNSVMKGGEVLVIPQNYIHGFQFSNDALGYVLTLAYPFFVKLANTLVDGRSALSYPFRYVVGENGETFYFRNVFEMFVQEYRGTRANRNLLVENLLTTIVILLAREVQDASKEEGDVREHSSSKDNVHFTKFTSLIEQWYDKHYSMSHYANEIGITSAHLNLLCRRISQKSPLQLIHERLILEAKRNLIYTSMTISELSYAIGFSDPAYFTRFFTRETKQSPKAFRKQADQLRASQKNLDSLIRGTSSPVDPHSWY